MSKQYKMDASCTLGLERLVAEEIHTFGGKEITSAKGVVTWLGNLESGYRACLWSRFSSRIFLQFAEFEVQDNECLYQRCSEVEWEHIFDCETTFAVDCSLGENSVIKHSKFAALRVKDAIADRFRKRRGKRPSVKVEQPGIRIHLHIQGKKALLSLDMSGESLHRRGYREATGTAPLKETLAAAIIRLAGWMEGDSEIHLLDPMCGSATLLIEAALIWGDSAPGLSRRYFGFVGWKGHDEVLWSSLVDEAIAREEAGMNKKWPVIRGYDADPIVVAAAQKNITRAGLEDKIKVGQRDMAFMDRSGKKGIVVCNPPYGQRLEDEKDVVYLYRALGRILLEHFNGWRAAIFISNPDIADRIGLKWEASYKLFNGPLACRLFVGPVASSYQKSQHLNFSQLAEQPQIPDEGRDFANRLIKNMRKLTKWAEKEGVYCFRIYDRDIPEYNICLDIYDRWLHVQEFAPPSSVDTDVAKRRLTTILAIIRKVFDVKREQIFIKTRFKQKGRRQYEKKAGKGRLLEVRERDCRFLVNLTDYIDTGLFLDHRPLREKIAKEIKGKRFLNLFGYTGTVTVCAAKGGAASTTTVDLSNTYLHWCRLNLSLNGFSGINHEIIRDDCVEWIHKTKKRFDLVFLDPPTFSNTKKTGRTFDIQRDHSKLITLAMARLDDGGLLLFSTNFRKFILDGSLFDSFDIVELTDQTIPFDFQRNPRIHRCWEFRKRRLQEA